MAYRGQQTIPGAPVLESVRRIQEAQEYGVKGMKWGQKKGGKESPTYEQREAAVNLNVSREDLKSLGLRRMARVVGQAEEEIETSGSLSGTTRKILNEIANRLDSDRGDSERAESKRAIAEYLSTALEFDKGGLRPKGKPRAAGKPISGDKPRKRRAVFQVNPIPSGFRRPFEDD